MDISKIKKAYNIIKEQNIVDKNVLEFMLTSSVKCALEETENKMIKLQQENSETVHFLAMSYFSNINLEDDRKKMFLRMLGLCSGLASKALLKSTGLEVDYKINGEDVSNLEKLHELSITEKIQLAVKEERYLDAANLKKLLDEKK